MKQLKQNEMLALQGGNICVIHPDNPLAILYCGCGPGYTIDAVLNGTFFSDPLYYSGIERFCTN